MKIDPKVHEQIVVMRKRGDSIQAVMKALNIGETAVLKYQSLPLLGVAPEEEHRLRRENRELRKDLDNLITQRAANKAYEDFVAEAASMSMRPPEWTYKLDPRKPKAIPTAFLSDTHFDEVIDPAQINYVNGYDRKIAGDRLKRFFHNSIELFTKYWSNIEYRGAVLVLGGDMLSGDIHEELKQTNAGTLCDGLLYWLEPMIAGIRMYADAFGSVLLPCCVGNHPRLSKKPVHKGRVRDNFDWLFCQLLARFLRDDPRVSFLIGDSPDIQYQLFDWSFLLTHGDQFKGGDGVAGLIPGVMRGDLKKRRRNQSTEMPYDYLLAGHFHQELTLPKVIMNGSLKGYDEYAANSNFDFEAPKQTAFLTDAKYGVTMKAPIHVLGDNEGWERSAPKVRKLSKD